MEKWFELLKYPVIGVTVFFVLLLFDIWLGVDLSKITKIGPGGLELTAQREETSTAMESLEERLNETIANVQIIEKKLEEQGAKFTDKDRKIILSASQEISSEVAKLSKPIEGKHTSVYGETGFMMIGQYDIIKSLWRKSNLAKLDGQIEQISPLKIVPNSEYIVIQSMVLRNGLPPNNLEYFRARRKIGTIPPRTKIRVLSTPVGIDREFAVEYWMNVEILE